MHNMLSLVKWILLSALFLVWLGLMLVNRAVITPLVVVPGSVVIDQLPLAMLLIAVFVSVFCVFWVAGLIDQLDNLLQARQLKKRISDLEAEVRQLRNLPIREGLRTGRSLEEENT